MTHPPLSREEIEALRAAPRFVGVPLNADGVENITRLENTALAALAEIDTLRQQLAAAEAECECEALRKALAAVASMVEPHWQGAGLPLESDWIMTELTDWAQKWDAAEDRADAAEAEGQRFGDALTAIKSAATFRDAVAIARAAISTPKEQGNG